MVGGGEGCKEHVRGYGCKGWGGGIPVGGGEGKYLPNWLPANIYISLNISSAKCTLYSSSSGYPNTGARHFKIQVL